MASAETYQQRLAEGLTPPAAQSVSQWADAHRILAGKASSEPGPWRTARTPYLREPMDCLSARNPVREVVCKFPIQFGKTEIASNTVGYTMDYHPGPIMVCLPGEVSMNKWVAQKLNPMLDESPVLQKALTSLASRDSANQRTFKDFAGGQLYLEHAGSPKRLKSSTVRTLIVDEIDEFPDVLSTGDDPVKMLNGRTSAYPSSYKRLYISTPGIAGISRIDAMWDKSDKRKYHIACPHCDHLQPLEWSGLHWSPDAREVWYACRACEHRIEEHEKTALIAAGRWIPEQPEATTRGYSINCLYYQFGLGPRWIDLVREWLDAQNDPGSLKTFINDRLAETWEDPAMRAVKHNIVADRAEPYRLRTAPSQVLAITAGVDTQDNRLAVQLVGWGRGMAAWTLDYIELPGDPADEGVWVMLTDLLNRPIARAAGGTMRVLAAAIDAGGHRTEAVKHYVRQRMITRPMAIFGAVPNNAPILSKGKQADVTWRGQTDRRGITIYHVGTVAAKHYLYSRLGADADKQTEARLVHFSDELPREFFPGLVSEVYNPVKNRFDRKYTRNEPLDTWVYAHAAAHHPELRLHRYSRADWDVLEARFDRPAGAAVDSRETPAAGDAAATPASDSRGTRPAPRRRTGIGVKDGWGL